MATNTTDTRVEWGTPSTSEGADGRERKNDYSYTASTALHSQRQWIENEPRPLLSRLLKPFLQLPQRTDHINRLFVSVANTSTNQIRMGKGSFCAYRTLDKALKELFSSKWLKFSRIESSPSSVTPSASLLLDFFPAFATDS